MSTKTIQQCLVQANHFRPLYTFHSHSAPAILTPSPPRSASDDTDNNDDARDETDDETPKASQENNRIQPLLPPKRPTPRPALSTLPPLVSTYRAISAGPESAHAAPESWRRVMQKEGHAETAMDVPGLHLRHILIECFSEMLQCSGFLLIWPRFSNFFSTMML